MPTARGTATVLFTDLVGSTQLSVAHGADFDDARRAHDSPTRAWERADELVGSLV